MTDSLLKSALTFLLVVCTLSVLAQSHITQTHKLFNAWIYTKENKEVKGVLIGASDSALFIYKGSVRAYHKEPSPQPVNVSFENIRLIKIKKNGQFLKGMLIGGGIGLSPIVFGEGGAYVAVFTFPVGLIVGSIVGATSKKKYKINGEAAAFAQFRRKYIK